MLVDILNPVAKQAGIQRSVDEARRFLSSQIEADGLVRYHGRPNAPTIGNLGCAITPDSDDTSLVWRIAPGTRRELMASGLQRLEQYRTPQGLYRTWLAPRERFQCIDPGKDPDPADAVIQMHIFMLLSQANPPAGRALCQSLRRSINDNSVWVYYKIAPTIPILRRSDVQQSGCPLELPPARLKTASASQDIWISAARAYDQASRGVDSANRSVTIALLRQLAQNNFAAIRQSPPLLYHNDLTASVARYYWSQEFGFALWLRLYFENMP